MLDLPPRARAPPATLPPRETLPPALRPPVRAPARDELPPASWPPEPTDVEVPRVVEAFEAAAPPPSAVRVPLLEEPPTLLVSEFPSPPTVALLDPIEDDSTELDRVAPLLVALLVASLPSEPPRDFPSLGDVLASRRVEVAPPEPLPSTAPDESDSEPDVSAPLQAKRKQPSSTEVPTCHRPRATGTERAGAFCMVTRRDLRGAGRDSVGSTSEWQRGNGS